MSSPELLEWQAYEKFEGPLGPQYRDAALRTLVELMRQQNYLIGGQYKSNPVPKPKDPYPLPNEFTKIKAVPDSIEEWSEE